MARLVRGIAFVVTLGALVFGGRMALARFQPRSQQVPTTRVERGQVDTAVHATGELRATRAQVLSAPAAGAQLRLLTLTPTGERVEAGAIVAAFDPSEQEYRLEEQRSQLREAELEIVKLQAESAAQAAQDDVDLMTARFDVQKAELDVQGRELLPAIDARKRELTLEEARRRLAQVEQDRLSRARSNDASLAVAAEKRNKARIAIDQAQRLLDQMTLRATMDGVVAVRENREGNFFFWGMTFSEYREGDAVSSGRVVAEVLGLDQLEFSARIAEGDRSQVAPGQTARLAFDSAGGLELAARVTAIGGIDPGRGFFSNAAGPTRQFDVSVAIDRVPASVRPGLTAKVTIVGTPLRDVLHLPRQAVFDRQGKPTVYVRQGEHFEPREVKVVARTSTVVVVEQVAEGTEVALTDPTRRTREGRPAAPSGSPARVVAQR
jgi:multidrug resistance efflux pump